MYCPSCGLQDTQSNQFCRSCGTDLGSVSKVVSNPSIAGASRSGRAEIELAIAEKIRQAKTSEELSTFAEDVLPEFEKFLQTPEEKRLARIRNGSLITLIGFGVSLGFFLAFIFGGDRDVLMAVALGIVTCCIGVAFYLNGLYFSEPKQRTATLESGDTQESTGEISSTTNELLMPPSAQREFTSVTEPTTRHLEKEKILERD